LKSQIIVDKKSKQVICTSFCNGKRHDFRLFKESKIHIHHGTKVVTDTGYQGIGENLTTEICKIGASEIFVISCNLNSWAKDFMILSDFYNLSLRHRLKYLDLPTEQHELVEQIRNEFVELFGDYL
jgi:tRNA/tmRNA/rRNA uracil-C5-methylase (TrmA/RlmC/RlmD family)